MRRTGQISAVLLAGLLLGTACAPNPEAARGKDEAPGLDPKTTLELIFTYGSEKETWLTEVTKEFNASGHQVGGKKVFVRAIPMGSGECIAEILSEGRKPHLTSPASNAFFVLGNAQSQAKTGKELVGKTHNLVLSPVVIAMWKPMAEALGWPDKPVGWADVKALAENKEGWGSLKYPQWGQFKLGHTHPDYSNSGLISVLAEVYAGAGKTSDLTVADVTRPPTARFVEAIERSVVHYGSSTGFFGRKMFANGPEYLSAAVLYENMVIESYQPRYKLPFPVVALYPKEGTFWSDHPVGVVQRPWVTDEHRQAAEKYIAFLMDRPQQEKALKSGFRPGLESVPLAAPVDKGHGVDPTQPKVELQPPPAEVIRAALTLWKANKKHSQVVLVLDTSGSMQIGGRMTNAKAGAKQLLGMLGDDDEVAIFAFSSEVRMIEKGVALKTGREALNRHVDAFFPAGETALYDAVDAAYRHLQANTKPGRATAVVVLTDGEDNKSRLNLEQLLARVKIDYEKRPIRVFCIAYGDEAREEVLRKISDATLAKAYKGSPKTIKAVFADIGTFF
jgi:Ca-activated chloride channel family protein